MSIYQLEAELDGQPAWSIERRKIFREACRKYYAGSYQPAPSRRFPDGDDRRPRTLAPSTTLAPMARPVRHSARLCQLAERRIRGRAAVA